MRRYRAGGFYFRPEVGQQIVHLLVKVVTKAGSGITIGSSFCDVSPMSLIDHVLYRREKFWNVHERSLVKVPSLENDTAGLRCFRMRQVRSGKDSEMASTRAEDQEISMLALHLLQLSLVYTNTLIIQKIWLNLRGPIA